MEYKFKKVEERGYVILEDGHTMFPDDVIKRFERLNFLEKERTGNVPEANACAQLYVCCPSQEDIDKAIDEYGFQVPYDGSNNFYDKDRMEHFKAGVEFVIKHIKGQ